MWGSTWARISRSAHPFGLLVLFISPVLVSAHLCNTSTHFNDLHRSLEQEGESQGANAAAAPLGVCGTAFKAARRGAWAWGRPPGPFRPFAWPVCPWEGEEDQIGALPVLSKRRVSPKTGPRSTPQP